MANAIKAPHGWVLQFENSTDNRNFATIKELLIAAYDLGYSTVTVYQSNYKMVGKRETINKAKL